MKIYISHSSEFNYKKELYDYLYKLNNIGDFFLPHKDDKVENTKDVIKNCDLVIAEISLPSTGQGIELGWANIFEKKIVCIYKKGFDYSSSLKIIADDFYEYDEKNLEEIIINIIEKYGTIR